MLKSIELASPSLPKIGNRIARIFFTMQNCEVLIRVVDDEREKIVMVYEDANIESIKMLQHGEEWIAGTCTEKQRHTLNVMRTESSHNITTHGFVWVVDTPENIENAIAEVTYQIREIALENNRYLKQQQRAQKRIIGNINKKLGE